MDRRNAFKWIAGAGLAALPAARARPVPQEAQARRGLPE